MMLKKQRGLILFICLSILPSFNCDMPPKKYYRMNSLWTKNVTRLAPADFDGDGIDEIVQISTGQIDVVDQKLNCYYKSFAMTNYENFYAAPIAGTSLDSVAFYIFTETWDTCMVDFLYHTNSNNLEYRAIRPVFRFPRDQREHRDHYDQNISYLDDFHPSDSCISIFRLNTARSLKYDRGILAYDNLNQKEKWRFTCGPHINSISFFNVDADTSKEIIFGSYAPYNGLIRNSTRDDSSYIFVLKKEGTLLWRKTMGNQFTGVFTYPGRFRPSGRQIVALTHSKSGEKNVQERIMILDGATGDILEEPRTFGRKIPENHYANFSRAADINRDGMDEIVIGNTDGYVRLLDKNLNLIAISKNYRKKICVRAICDLNGDGFLEIICQLPYEKIIILDHGLEEMAVFPLEVQSSHRIYPVKNGATSRLLLHSPFPGDSGATHIWRMLELQESLVPFEAYSGLAKYFWWALGGISFLSVLLISFTTRKRAFRRMFVQLLTQAKLFDSALLLNKNGLIMTAGRHWLDLANIHAGILSGRHIEKIQSLPDSLRSNIQKSLSKKTTSQYNYIIENNGQKTPILVQVNYIKMLSLYRATLRFISEENFLANIKHWSNAAQKLAHGIKNPLTSMKLNLDELASHVQDTTADKEAALHVEAIDLQIEKLRRMADGFTRFIEFEEPALSAIDTNEFIKKTVAQLTDDIPKNIRIKLDLGQALPTALFNAEQLCFAFENVLFNAVQSITDHGTILIQTEFIRHYQNSTEAAQDYVEIRLQDNGVGIDADVLSKVTDPYYTTKKDGTGLGLNLVVKIMEMLDGKFDIQSRKGEGTIVILRLKSAA